MHPLLASPGLNVTLGESLLAYPGVRKKVPALDAFPFNSCASMCPSNLSSPNSLLCTLLAAATGRAVDFEATDPDQTNCRKGLAAYGTGPGSSGTAAEAEAITEREKWGAV